MVHISQSVKKQIFIHSEIVYPEECCGLLLGIQQDGVRYVRELSVLHNAQEGNREGRFLIRPEQYRQTERLAKDKNLELIGCYHSHPNHQAVPSQFDAEHALPYFLYMIISVLGRQSQQITAWLLSEHGHRFEEQPVSIE